MYPTDRTKFSSLRLLAWVGALGALLVGCSNSGQAGGGADEVPFVAVTQMVENASLDAVRDGVQDALAEVGYEADRTLRWEWRSAQGNPVKAAQIADKYAWARPDVIVAIATPSAQPLIAATKNTPIVFSAVSDPVGDQLVKSIEKPGGNTSGVSDRTPISQQLALIKEILPAATTIGVIYNAEEASSISLLTLVNENTAAQNLGIQAVTAATPSEVTAAANSLVGLVDAFYVLPNSTVGSALDSVIQVGRDNQIPVFAGDRDSVERGAIATVSFDYYDMGRQTGAMVIKVLKGSRPGDLAVEFVEDLKLSVNLAAAESMGVELPVLVTLRADETL